MNSTVFDQNVIKNWVNEGNIQTLVNYLEQIFEFSNIINDQIDFYFTDHEQYIQLILIVCCIVMIPLNILIILYARKRFFTYLNHILSSS